MLPSEKYDMPVLGKLTTRRIELVRENLETGEKTPHVLEAAEYEYIGGEVGAYIVNQWYKEDVAQLIPVTMIETVTPYKEE